MRLVKYNVPFCHSEVSKKFSDLLDSCVKRQASNLHMLIFVFFCKIVWKSHKPLSFLHLKFRLFTKLILLCFFSNKRFSWFIYITLSATAKWSWIVASSASPGTINVLGLIVRLEVLLSVSSTTTSSLTSTAASGLKITTTTSPESVCLFHLEILVILIGYKSQLNKACADVFLLSVVVSELGIFGILELDDCLTSNLSCWVFANFNGVFYQSKAVEKFFNVVVYNAVR